MTHWRDTDRMLDRWMDDGPTVVTDHVIAGAMTEIQTTRQRGTRWAPLKELFMISKHAAMAVGIATVVIVGIAAYQLMPDGSPSVGASPSPTAPPDLAGIVVMNENAPDGWTFDATLRGRNVLAYLIRYGEAVEAGNAFPGFVDARATEFCAEGQGCGASWVGLYGSEADADAAFELFHGEMLVGWGLGFDGHGLDLGEDEGRAYSNNLGNAAAHDAYLWRTGTLLLGVIGLAVPEGEAELEHDALRSIAEAMNARSR